MRQHQQGWKPWVNVETGMVPATPFLPALSGPPLLKTSVVPSPEDPQKAVRALLVGLAFAAVAGFHGYKRSGSPYWALIWAAGGFVCPVVTLPLAVHQGFAQKKG